MTKQLAIAARDHDAGIADQRLHGMARGRRLPFAAVERAEPENDLRDFLAGGAGAIAVEGLQHPSQPRPLLAGQACVRRDRAAMQGGEKTMDRFEPIQPVHAERNDRGGGCDAIMDELKMLTVAEVDQHIGRTVRGQRDGGVDLRQGLD